MKCSRVSLWDSALGTHEGAIATCCSCSGSILLSHTWGSFCYSVKLVAAAAQLPLHRSAKVALFDFEMAPFFSPAKMESHCDRSVSALIPLVPIIGLGRSCSGAAATPEHGGSWTGRLRPCREVKGQEVSFFFCLFPTRIVYECLGCVVGANVHLSEDRNPA